MATKPPTSYGFQASFPHRRVSRLLDHLGGALLVVSKTEARLPGRGEPGDVGVQDPWLLGVSASWGYLKMGWFISWKIPSFDMDDDWGYPYDETETSIWACSVCSLQLQGNPFRFRFAGLVPPLDRLGCRGVFRGPRHYHGYYLKRI